jgi:hypothetical protein
MSSRALIVGLAPSTLGSDVTELGAVDPLFNGGFSKAGGASASVVGEDVVVVDICRPEECLVPKKRKKCLFLASEDGL